MLLSPGLKARSSESETQKHGDIKSKRHIAGAPTFPNNQHRDGDSSGYEGSPVVEYVSDEMGNVCEHAARLSAGSRQRRVLVSKHQPPRDNLQEFALALAPRRGSHCAPTKSRPR